MPERQTRDQVPPEQTWNLDDIYQDGDAWQADRLHIEQDIRAVTAFQGRLGEGAPVLLACLEALDVLRERLDKVGGYARLSAAVDGTSPQNQGMLAQANAVEAHVDAETAFIRSELVALPPDTIEAYRTLLPDLDPYRALLDAAERQRGHLLQADAERALAALGEVFTAPYTIWQIATAVDLHCAPARDTAGREYPVSISSYFGAQSQSPDRELRASAYASLAAGLGARKASLATALATHIRANVALAKLRGFGTATEMILAEQQVPAAVYHNVLDVVYDEIAPHVRRLMRLRARVVGVDQLRRYDLDAPLDPHYAPATSFHEASSMIRRALQPLGEGYAAIMDDAFDKRWIDRADNMGKRSGAFCARVQGVHPYVFVTWQDTLRNAFTLAHELGHAGHGVLQMRRQRAAGLAAARPIFMVEAPSTANEMLLGRYLLDTITEPRERRWVITQLLKTFTHNMVTHLLEGHFERRLYALAEAGEPLTLDTIMHVQGEVFERFYAGTVETDQGARLYWAQQPHFYINLYPYTYAAGLACGCAVTSAIGAEGQPAVDRWLHMLELGNSLPPIELLRIAGVDISRPDPLRVAVRYFATLVDELESSLR